jgi:hypothetical protein
MGLSFTIAADPRQRIHSQIRVPRFSWPTFITSDSRFSQPGGPSRRIYKPQEQGVPIIPQTLGSIFVTYYDSQSSSSYTLGTDLQETQFPSLFQQFLCCYRGVPTSPLHTNGSSSIVAYVIVAAGMCLPSCCLASTLAPLFQLSSVMSQILLKFNLIRSSVDGPSICVSQYNAPYFPG